jgi:hypothetical protein
MNGSENMGRTACHRRAYSSLQAGEPVGGVGMRVALGRSAVGRPPGMADADRARERLACEPPLEIAQLAFGAPPRELPAFQRGDAGGIVASVLEPLERVDEQARDRLTSIAEMMRIGLFAAADEARL